MSDPEDFSALQAKRGMEFVASADDFANLPMQRFRSGGKELRAIESQW